jgi:RNA recognition motif-containing protein
LLLHYVSRFGKVEQSKAIIDTSTGACKGYGTTVLTRNPLTLSSFGFAKFADVRDSEKCIRGFYYLGYEVSFARESFNARLKAEGDKSSTNLYFSNLPKSITKVELYGIFAKYHVVSSRILRDSMGNGRGVGFA